MGQDALNGIAVSPSEKLAACGAGLSFTLPEYGACTCVGGDFYSEILITLDSSGSNLSGGVYDANLPVDYCSCGNGGYLYGIAADRFGFAVVGFVESASWPSDGGAGCSGECGGSSYGWDARFADDYGSGVASITSTKGDTVCRGDAVTLSVDYTYPPYHWRLNGALISGATSNTYSPNTSTLGSYTYSCDLVLPSGNLCPQSADYFLTVLAPPQITAIAINGTPCPGSKVSLVPTITGTPPFQYSWSPVSTLDNPNSAQPYATVGKDSVIYTLVVSNACSSASKTVTVIPSSSILSGGGTRVICAGSSTELTVNVTGARAISYSWSPNFWLNRRDSSTVIATPKTSTYYTVTVTNSEGCTLNETFLVTVDPILNVSVKADSMRIICPSDSIRLLSTVTGGTKPYSYLWSPHAGLSNDTLSSCVAVLSKTTTYILRVTDFYGCIREDYVTITVWSLPKFLKQQDTITVCPIAAMKIGDSAQGGTPPYLYHWINSSGPSPKWGSSPYTIVKADTSRIYTEEVKDVHDCYGAQKTFLILVSPTPSKPNISPSDTVTVCGDTSICLHASKGYASYLWNDGSLGSSADSLIATSVGKYYVTVFNDNRCRNTSDTVTIRMKRVTPDIEGPGSVCPQSVSNYLAKVVKGDRLGWTLNGGGKIRTTSHPIR